MIQDHITAVEKHLGLICDTFGSYTRKTARLRDKGYSCLDISYLIILLHSSESSPI